MTKNTLDPRTKSFAMGDETLQDHCLVSQYHSGFAFGLETLGLSIIPENTSAMTYGAVVSLKEYADTSHLLSGQLGQEPGHSQQQQTENPSTCVLLHEEGLGVPPTSMEGFAASPNLPEGPADTVFSLTFSYNEDQTRTEHDGWSFPSLPQTHICSQQSSEPNALTDFGVGGITVSAPLVEMYAQEPLIQWPFYEKYMGHGDSVNSVHKSSDAQGEDEAHTGDKKLRHIEGAIKDLGLLGVQLQDWNRQQMSFVENSLIV